MTRLSAETRLLIDESITTLLIENMERERFDDNFAKTMQLLRSGICAEQAGDPLKLIDALCNMPTNRIGGQINHQQTIQSDMCEVSFPRNFREVGLWTDDLLKGLGLNTTLIDEENAAKKDKKKAVAQAPMIHIPVKELQALANRFTHLQGEALQQEVSRFEDERATVNGPLWIQRFKASLTDLKDAAQSWQETVKRLTSASATAERQ